MIRINTNLSSEECRIILKQNIVVHNINPTLIMATYFLKNEMIGDVFDNEFWLQKIIPRYYHGVPRLFKGKIIDDNGKTLIMGKFKYPIIYVIFFLYIFVAVVNSLTARIIVFFVLLVISKLNILLYKKEEAEVISFLDRTFNSN